MQHTRLLCFSQGVHHLEPTPRAD